MKKYMLVLMMTKNWDNLEYIKFLDKRIGGFPSTDQSFSTATDSFC